MRVKGIVVGLAAVIAMVGMAACSSGTPSAGPKIAVAAEQATVAPSTEAPSTVARPTVTPSTSEPTTTTTPKPVPTTTKAPAAKVVSKRSSVPCSAAAKACVDLSRGKAWLVDDGKIVYGPVSIMSGRRGWPTPIGTFHVEFKDADYFSHEFKVPMPDAVFFYPGIAFHEGSLYEHSHGCIHLSRTSASKFFHTLHVGDEVQVIR